jgi:hypothetical protein
MRFFDVKIWRNWVNEEIDSNRIYKDFDGEI